MAIKERAAHKAAADAQEQLAQVQTPLQTTGASPKSAVRAAPKAPVSLEQAEQALEAASREHERIASNARRSQRAFAPSPCLSFCRS